MTALPARYKFPAASDAMAEGVNPSFKYVEKARFAGEAVCIMAAATTSEPSIFTKNSPEWRNAEFHYSGSKESTLGRETAYDLWGDELSSDDLNWLGGLRMARNPSEEGARPNAGWLLPRTVPGTGGARARARSFLHILAETSAAAKRIELLADGLSLRIFGAGTAKWSRSGRYEMRERIIVFLAQDGADQEQGRPPRGERQ